VNNAFYLSLFPEVWGWAAWHLFSFFTFVKILSNQQVFSFLSFSVFKRFLKLLYSLWRFLCFFLYLEGTDNNNNERQVNSKSTTRDIN